MLAVAASLAGSASAQIPLPIPLPLGIVDGPAGTELAVIAPAVDAIVAPTPILDAAPAEPVVVIAIAFVPEAEPEPVVPAIVEAPATPAPPLDPAPEGVPVQAPGPDPAPVPPPAPVVAVVHVSAAPGPAARSHLTSATLGSVAMIWGAASLYLRLGRPDVLGHKEREKLHRAIEARPGVHFHALQRDLGWNAGTLTYHLRVLERHGFVVSRRDGPYRRVYVQGAAPRKEAFPAGVPRGLRADVLGAVRSQPGISQTDLAMALRAHKQTVNYHVKALERADVLRVEKRGRETFLHPQGDP